MGASYKNEPRIERQTDEIDMIMAQLWPEVRSLALRKLDILRDSCEFYQWNNGVKEIKLGRYAETYPAVGVG